MSPSIDILESGIGRMLRPNDVLATPSGQTYEVVKGFVAKGEGQLPTSETCLGFELTLPAPGPTIKVRLLTPHGPTTETNFLPRGNAVIYSGIIPREKRTDVPLFKRLLWKITSRR